MMLNICKLLPVIYIPIAFIGNCFAGAIASSHAFLSFNWSISSVVGAFRADLSAASCFPFDPDLVIEVGAVYPGGSGKEEFFDRVGAVEFKSRTHCGGGGTASAAIVRKATDCGILIAILC